MNRSFRIFLIAGVALSFFSTAACTKKETTSADPRATLVARGRAVYLSSCIACHNSDPRKPGAVGPEIFGASPELLEARILRAEYPPGYAPKRATRAMAALPYLKNDLGALHAYLNEGAVR